MRTFHATPEILAWREELCSAQRKEKRNETRREEKKNKASKSNHVGKRVHVARLEFDGSIAKRTGKRKRCETTKPTSRRKKLPGDKLSKGRNQMRARVCNVLVAQSRPQNVILVEQNITLASLRLKAINVIMNGKQILAHGLIRELVQKRRNHVKRTVQDEQDGAGLGL